MSAEASPTPWQTSGRFDIVDAHGMFLFSCYSYLSKTEAEDRANAALIVDAVNFYDATVDTQLTALLNERDRLRDLVRRLARIAQDTLDFAEAMSGIIPDHPERAKARSEITSLLREARAAIGEKKE